VREEDAGRSEMGLKSKAGPGREYLTMNVIRNTWDRFFFRKEKGRWKRDRVMNRRVKKTLDSCEGKIMVINARVIIRNTENENKEVQEQKKM